PVIRIAFVDDVTAARPLLELVGAGADRRAVQRILKGVFKRVAVGRQNRGFTGGQRQNQVRGRLREVQPNRVRIHRLRVFQAGQRGSAARVVLLGRLQREDHVFSGEEFAVVPAHVRAQREGVSQAV